MTDTKKTLPRKLLDIMASIEKLKKDGHNKFHNYDFVSEANVMEAVRGLFVEHGVMVVPSVEYHWQEPRKTKADGDTVHSFAMVKYSLIDVDTGETMEVRWLGEGQDSGDKGFYKAYTGAQKYFELKTMMIPTGDGDDPESDAAEAERPAPRRAAPKEATGKKTAGGASEKSYNFTRKLFVDRGICESGHSGETEDGKQERRDNNKLAVVEWLVAHEYPAGGEDPLYIYDQHTISEIIDTLKGEIAELENV